MATTEKTNVQDAAICAEKIAHENAKQAAANHVVVSAVMNVSRSVNLRLITVAQGLEQ